MKRLTGWEQRLAAATRSAMAKRYTWGLHDCALFAADCILAMTGRDLAADFRGLYDSEASASEVLASLGCKDVGDLAGRYFEEIPPTQAKRGDVVLIPGERGAFLAIVDGRTAVGPALRGLTHVQLSLASRAWSVA